MFGFSEFDDENDVSSEKQSEDLGSFDEEEVLDDFEDDSKKTDDDEGSRRGDAEQEFYVKKIKQLEDEVSSLKDLNLRIRAEFDNFKKRTNKEKQGIEISAQSDCVLEFLPLLDGLERGFDSFNAQKAQEGVIKGFQMLIDTCADILKKLGVESVGKKGEQFNPKFHNAIKTVEIEGPDKNIVYEVLLKGYCKGDNVIRHAMVVVANP